MEDRMSETLPYFIELRMLFNTTRDGIADVTRRVDKAAEDFPIRPDGTASRPITKETLEYEIESRYKIWYEEILDTIRAYFGAEWTEKDEHLLRKWLYKRDETLNIIGPILAEAFVSAHEPD